MTYVGHFLGHSFRGPRPALLVAAITLLLLAAVLFLYTVPAEGSSYAVVIDSGSTGTRM